MKSIFMNLFSVFKIRKERAPSSSGLVIALSGAILIGTDEKNTIVITPEMARTIARALPQLADEAERASMPLAG